jgi:hypothetical protein
MKRLACFLILLLITDQVDDACALAADSPGTPLAADDDHDDDYLPAQRQSALEQPPSGQQPAFLGRNRHLATLSCRRAGLPPGWDLTAPFTPPPLYVLVSLQI